MQITPLVWPQASVWWGCGENGALLAVWRVWLFWKTLAVPQKVEVLTWEPANPSPMNSMTWKHLPTQKTCTWTLTAFNITSKREKQSKCPSPDKWIKCDAAIPWLYSHRIKCCCYNHMNSGNKVWKMLDTKAHIEWFYLELSRIGKSVDNWLGAAGAGEGEMGDCQYG